MASLKKSKLESLVRAQEVSIFYIQASLTDVDMQLVKATVKTDKKNKRYKTIVSQVIDNDQKKKLDEAEQSVAKHSGKRKKITNIICFIVNIAVLAGILLYQLLGKEFLPLSGLHINGWATLIIFLLFIASVVCEMLAMSYLIKKSVGKWRFGLSFKMNTIGHYYDAITPLATGGQPFQITYLKSHDIPLHSALAIPLAKYVFSQIVWVLVSLICMIVSFAGGAYNTYVVVISAIGFVLGSFMLFVTLFLSISKSVGRKLVVKVLKLAQKMKIVKNYEKQYEKISKYIEDFQTVMKQYAISFKDFMILFGSLLLKLIISYSIPYFVFCMFHGFEGGQYFHFFVMAILVDLAASFFPLPGGTGMSEVSYSAMFGAYFSGGVLFWALLMWRFMTYYIYLLLGISVLTYDFAYGNRKYRWQKRKEELSEESRIFKQDQINRFRAQRQRNRRRNQSLKF